MDYWLVAVKEDNMDLGEKIMTISNIIYSMAYNELNAQGINDTLSIVIMENVFSRFVRDGHNLTLLNELKNQSESKSDVKTGTAEDLLKDIERINKCQNT